MDQRILMRLSKKGIVLPFVIPFFLVIGWYYLAGYVGNPVILPKVESIAKIFSHPSQELIGIGSLVGSIAISLARVIVGYCMAVFIGVPLGILMGYHLATYHLLNNFFNLFRPIPPLAWVPLVLAWFGITSLATLFQIEPPGLWYIYLNNLKISMIFIIFIGGFFPILTSSIYGVRNVRKVLTDLVQMLGASQLDIFKKVLVPAAAPSIVNGMRIGLGVSWMCLVSAEMLPGSVAGVGYLIIYASTLARTDVVIAGMISIGALGAIMDIVFRIIEGRSFRWNRLSR